MKFPSLLSRMDRLPPCLCRLFARRRVGGGDRGWAPKSHREIAEESGLPKSTVADLSRKRSWANLPIDVADRFAAACGVNLAHVDDALMRARKYRSRVLGHIGKGNGHQRRMIADLLEQSKPSTKNSP